MESFEDFKNKKEEFLERLDLNPEKATPFKVHNEIQALLMLDGAPFDNENETGPETVEINIEENKDEDLMHLSPLQKHQVNWIKKYRQIYNQAFDELMNERPTMFIEWYDDPQKIADMVKNRMNYIEQHGAKDKDHREAA